MRTKGLWSDETKPGPFGSRALLTSGATVHLSAGQTTLSPEPSYERRDLRRAVEALEGPPLAPA